MLRVLSQNKSNQNSIKASSCQHKRRQKNVNDIDGDGDGDGDVDVDTEADVMQKRTPPNYWFHVAGKKSMPATTGENWLNWKTLALPSQATLDATKVPASFFVVRSSGLRHLLHLRYPLQKHQMGLISTVHELSSSARIWNHGCWVRRRNATSVLYFHIK